MNARMNPPLLDAARASVGMPSTPGLSIALIEHGSLIDEQACGLAMLGEPLGRHHLLQAASLAKPLAACALLRLAERDGIDLEAPVNSLLHGWKLASDRFPVEQVSLRRVLSHCAGLSIPDYPGLDPALPVPSVRESLDGASGLPLRLIAPAGRFAYSGGGYALVQLLIEELTGKSFAAHLQRTLLDPLDMRHSSFDPRSPLLDAAVAGHAADGSPLPFYRFDAAAAAGLNSTAGDLARFLIGVMDGRVLSGGMLAAATTSIADTGHADGLWSGYGLGWEIETLADGRRLIGHHGMNRGFRALMAADPDAQRGLVLLANGDGAMPALERLFHLWCDA